MLLENKLLKKDYHDGEREGKLGAGHARQVEFPR